MAKNHKTLTVTVSNDIYEAIEREKCGQTKSAFVNDILWCALIATPEQIKMINSYTEVINA